MVQQRLLDEKVGDVDFYLVCFLSCESGAPHGPLALTAGPLSPPAGGHSRPGSAGRDVSQVEVPPAEETAVQEVGSVLAQEPKGSAPVLEPSENGAVVGQPELLRQ